MKRTSAPSARRARSSAHAWIPCPPRMSRLAATTAILGRCERSSHSVSTRISGRDPGARMGNDLERGRGGGRLEPRRPAVEEGPAPELEGDQGPQLQVVRPPGAVSVDEMLDV